MKKFFLLLLLLPLQVLSQTQNYGSTAVVCRSAGKIVSAELVDLFEGREIHNLSFEYQGLGVEAILKVAQLPLINHTSFLNEFRRKLYEIKTALKFVSSDVILQPTNEDLPGIRRKNCKIEPVSNIIDDTRILISKEIYDAFEVSSKAGLLIHETIFAVRRNVARASSRNTRKLVGHLLANNGDQRVIDSLIKHVDTQAPSSACGLQGSIEERIENCRVQRDGWALVVRTRGKFEIWKDLTSGYIWSETLPWSQGVDPRKAMSDCKIESEEKGWLKGNWSLPSPAVFLEADRNGIRYVLSMKKKIFWTTEFKEDRYWISRRDGLWRNYFLGKVFNGSDGRFEDWSTIYVEGGVATRCVLKVN